MPSTSGGVYPRRAHGGDKPRRSSTQDLVARGGRRYHQAIARVSPGPEARGGLKPRRRSAPMSIDKSLRRKGQLQRARNVLTRGERIKTLQDDERWQGG